MASAAQVRANRLNAQKSTGPRTPKGKAVVAQNTVKHGLLAREAVIKGEDPGQFEFYRDQMLDELVPVGQVESLLAERVVSLSWRLQRAERLQNEVFDSMYLQEATCDYGKMLRTRMSKGLEDSPEAGDLVRGLVVVEDFANSKVLDRLLMYERRIEHSLYRTMAELQRQRLLRELDPATARPTPEAGSPVGSVPVRASRSTGILPVVLNHGRDAHATETPDSVTTNTPAAEDPSCKTNPISPGPNEGQVPCGTEVMNDSPSNGLGETNPISEEKGHADLLSLPSVCSVPVRASDSEVSSRVGLAPPRPVPGEESVGQAPPYNSPEEVGRGRPTYEEPPDGVTTNSPNPPPDADRTPLRHACQRAIGASLFTIYDPGFTIRRRSLGGIGHS